MHGVQPRGEARGALRARRPPRRRARRDRALRAHRARTARRHAAAREGADRAEGPELLPLRQPAGMARAPRLPARRVHEGRGPRRGRRARAPRRAQGREPGALLRRRAARTRTRTSSRSARTGACAPGPIVDEEGRVVGSPRGRAPLHRRAAQGARRRARAARRSSRASTPERRRCTSGRRGPRFAVAAELDDVVARPRASRCPLRARVRVRYRHDGRLRRASSHSRRRRTRRRVVRSTARCAP